MALLFLLVLGTMTSLFVSNLASSTRSEASYEAQTKSFYIAEAGLNHAVWKLAELGDGYAGEKGIRFGAGRFDVGVEDYAGSSTKKIVTVTARLDGYRTISTREHIRAVALLRKTGGGYDVTIESWQNIR